MFLLQNIEAAAKLGDEGIVFQRGLILIVQVIEHGLSRRDALG